jgi:hypothetical protein
MKDPKLFRALKHIELTAEEKAAGREQFLSFMEAHQPLARDKKTEKSVSWFRPFRMLATAFVLLVVCTGGVSYAAESSVPGDLLYPIKINFNEQVRSTFTFNSKSKAEWNMEQVERRLEEAETLKEEGRMTPELRAQIKTEIEVHQADMEDRLQNLEEQGKTESSDEIKIRYENLLQIHQDTAKDVEVIVRPPRDFFEESSEWKPKFQPWDGIKELSPNSDFEEPETDTSTPTETETQTEAEAETEEKNSETTDSSENNSSGIKDIDTSLPGITDPNGL